MKVNVANIATFIIFLISRKIQKTMHRASELDNAGINKISGLNENGIIPIIIAVKIGREGLIRNCLVNTSLT